MLMFSKYDDIFHLIWFNLLFSKNILEMKNLSHKGVLAETAAFKGKNNTFETNRIFFFTAEKQATDLKQAAKDIKIVDLYVK